jgi:prevent-host-death family protein
LRRRNGTGTVLGKSNRMKQLNLSEAKADLSRLVDQAAKGKSVIIAKAGIPMAKLVPLDDGKPKKFKRSISLSPLRWSR